MEQTIITKSLKEGFSDFGEIVEISDLSLKNKEGEEFLARGFRTTSCFVILSRKLQEEFPKMETKDILKNVFGNINNFQFACKPGVSWKNGQPIWTLTTCGRKLIQRATSEEVSNLNKMLGF